MLVQTPLTRDYISSLNSNPNISPNALIEELSDLESYAIIICQHPETAELLDTVELLSIYYSSYLLALLLADDLNEARFLSHRITTYVLQPNKPASTYPLLPPSVSLLKSLYTRSYPSSYQILQGTPWGPYVQPLASRLLSQLRLKMFKLLSYAYTTISPHIAAKFLGYENGPIESVIEKLVAEGWSWDDKSGLLNPVSKGEIEDKEFIGVLGTARPESENIAGYGPGNGKDGRIARLAGLVTHLTETS